jgi:DNA-binding transcriptional MocR family regulator
MLELAFTPDRDRTEPVYRQLRDYLRDLIAAERLPRGTKLPATRELATSLGLSRNTVAQAYDELVADGLAAAHVGQGTFVATPLRPADDTRRAAARAQTADDPPRGFAWSGLFALRARALAVPSGLVPRRGGPVRWDFRGGQIALDTLPTAELRRVFGQVLATELRDVAAVHTPYGLPVLRREIARYLVTRGIACEPDDVAVVNGAQQAIDLATRVLVDPGDSVVLEEPGYFGARVAFAAAQANVIAVDVDAHGLDTDALARVLRARRVKLVYTTPAAQSPTGVVLSDDRRRALLELADEHQVPILEDDYDSELRYEGPPIAALKTRDRAGQLIYVGTFSKVLFPGLRVGYVVAARPLLDKMMLARWNADVTTNVIGQAALAHLLASGGLTRHLKRVRVTYAARLDAMLQSLASAMPEGVTWTTPRGGHSVWVTLPAGTDPDALMQSTLDAGLYYTPGDVFCGDGRGGRHLALSFANHTPAEITAGIGLLGTLLRKQRASGRRSARA